MKIAIFSADCNGPDSFYEFWYSFRPLRSAEWDRIAKEYPEHEFKVFFILPHGMVVDAKKNDIVSFPQNVSYEAMPISDPIDKLADRIAAWEPDTAICITIPSLPFDWNNMRDSLLGKALKKRGINTIAHGEYISYISCDKQQTNSLLRQKGFYTADSIHINSHTFREHIRDTQMISNVYLEYKMDCIRELSFPVVIKSTGSAGSIGLKVAKTYEEAEKILFDYKGESDLVVEEWISGDSFGIEVWGVPGSYMVLDPIKFTVTGDGVTDPFTSYKIGPFTDPSYDVEGLKKEIERMAGELGLCGAAEIDLIYHEGKWYIVEINARCSYLTPASTSMAGMGMFDPYIRTALGKLDEKIKNRYVLDFKTKRLPEELIDELWEKCPIICSIMNASFRNSPDEEIEMCEFVVGGVDTVDELLSGLSDMREKYPDVVSENVINAANELLWKVGGDR